MRDFKVLILSGVVVVGVSGAALARQDIQAVIGNVFLQNITPGTVQAGSFSVNGTGTVGKLRIGNAVVGGALVKVEDAGTNGGAYIRSKGTGVYGANTAATGLGIGGSFASTSTGGRGLYGDATSATGTTRGGFFRSLSTSGTGGYGLAAATAGKNYGLIGESMSYQGTGIKAVSYGSNVQATFGLEAYTTSGYGAAVYAKNTSTFPYALGVYAEGGAAIQGVGTVYGVTGSSNVYSPVTPNYGVYGFSANDNANSIGTKGEGYADFGYSGFGVFGTAYGPGTKWGLYSDTNLGVVGTKSFEIDHPLDPENKTLRHYCAEGDKPLLVYQGEVKLDSAGNATVKVADYVQAIGKDFGYQLTPIGSAMPGLYVSKRFTDGRFGLSGGTPNGSVSWTLTGTRNDKWVQANGAPVEVQKTGSMAGKYLRPELYGQPETRGAFYNPDRQKMEQRR